LVRFSFDAGTGSLVQIESLRTGGTHLGDPARGRLFRVMCPDGRRQSRHADSHDAPTPEFDVESNRLTIRYPELLAKDGSVKVSATVQVELPPDSAEALFTLEITHHRTERLHEIRFPWVGGWTGFAGRGKDKAFCGVMPAEPWPISPEIFSYTIGGHHRRHYFNYNDRMLLPFFDVSGDGRGLSYICYQQRPAVGRRVVENLDPEPHQLSWSWAWVHLPFARPGGTWRSPTIGIGVHESDWHATADRFRSWLDTWWKAPKPPERLRQSIGFQVVLIRNFDGVPCNRFRDIPRLAAEGRKYGVDDLCIWDAIQCVYLRPDDGELWEEFDPTQTLDDLRAGLTEAKRAGTNMSAMPNYRLIRGNSSLYRRIGAEQVQRTIYGSPVIEEWTNWSSGHGPLRVAYMGREGYVLCQRPKAFRERALAITKQSLELGFTSLFIDQAFDYNPCLSDAHGHRSPDDTHEAALEWFVEAMAMTRRRDPDAYVLGELAEMFTAQHLDVSWNWGWAWLAPEIMRYTLPETICAWVVDHQPSVLNRLFTMGFLAGFFTAGAEKSLEAYPEFGARVKQLAALRQRTAEFIAHGRFRDQIGLQVEDALAYVYASLAGIGVTIADVEKKPRRVRITVDPARLNRTKPQPGTLFRQDGASQAAGEVLPDGRIQLVIELRALEVAVWMLPQS
jgi:hypothetical protein